jgi:hypothetical protein
VSSPDDFYEELTELLRNARRSLLSISVKGTFELYDFAQARAAEVSPSSYEDRDEWREHHIRAAAAMFVSEPLGPTHEIADAYDAHVLGPMREVMDRLERRLANATVPEKLAHFNAARPAVPGEATIRAAINLLIASTIPGSDMNY